MTSYLWISTHERQSASIHNNKYVSLFKGKLSRMCSCSYFNAYFYDMNWKKEGKFFMELNIIGIECKNDIQVLKLKAAESSLDL